MSLNSIVPLLIYVAMICVLFAISFYLASVEFGIPVVVDANEEDVASVFGNLSWILLALTLVDGSVSSVVEFQFDDEGWLVDVTAGNHH